MATAKLAFWTKTLEHLRDFQGDLQVMDVAACIKAYSTDFVSSRADVLLISSYENTNNSILGFKPTNFLGNDITGNTRSAWIDYGLEKPKSKDTLPPNKWVLRGYEVKHCLSQQVEEVCRVQFHVAIMVIVIICNFIKWTTMSVIWWQGRQVPLMTIGDAIASFLDDSDLTTKGRCLMDRDDFRVAANKYADTVKWNPVKTRWFRAAAWSRWILCVIRKWS